MPDDAQRDAALALTAAFVSEHSTEAAQILEGRPASATAALLERLPIDEAVPLARALTPGTASDALALLPAEVAARLMERLPADQRLLVARQLAATAREPIVSALPRRTREHLRDLLRFGEESVGALMQTDVFSVPVTATIREARSRARRRRDSARYYVYTIDERGRLVGVLTLGELMLSTNDQSAAQTVAAIMKPASEALRVDLDRLELLHHPGWRRFHSLPVVNAEGVLVGRVSYQTLRSLEHSQRERGPGPVRALDLAVGVGDAWLRGMATLMNGLLGGERRS